MPPTTTAVFEKLSSVQKVEFWFELVRKKTHELKLDDSPVPLTGFFRTSQSSGGDGSFHRKLEVTLESFSEAPSPGMFEFTVPGVLMNFNTIEEYNALDRKEALAKQAATLFETIRSRQWLSDPRMLYRFVLYCFADLKKYTFPHRMLLPILAPEVLIQREPFVKIAEVFSQDAVKGLRSSWEAARTRNTPGSLAHCPVFAARRMGDNGLSPVIPLSELTAADEDVVLCFADPCGTSHFGWVARNPILACGLCFGWKTVRALSLREALDGSLDNSLYTVFHMPHDLPILPEAEEGVETEGLPLPKYLKPYGWEPQQPPVSLKSLLDPEELAAESSQLNLRLMKWRAVPELDLESISSKSCLLVGSGTLGCGVARNLLKWGITKITFLDCGRVSHSNTVRQSLFEHKDAVEGRHKAEAAAEACKRIYPKAETTWRDLKVPMPGHLVNTEEEKETEETVKQFESLIEAHDVLFLLTDSRESRWLPTVLGAKHRKIVMNAALGFEGWVAMRHGSPACTDIEKRVGCYFCTDISSPTDSLSDRTLDQQCTVTRPGVSDIASALAVELLVSLLTHPLGNLAPAPTGSDKDQRGVLGYVPHQIRGGLTFFDQQTVRGACFDRCVACSDHIIGEYQRRGFEFLLEVFNDSKGEVLAKVSGIRDMLKGFDDGDMGIEDLHEDDEA